MDEHLCAKCGLRNKQDDPKAMYPDFCRDCADAFKRVLDKHGLLNELKRKNKIK